MKVKTANEIRSTYISNLMGIFANEDVGQITSGSFNFPIVKDEEEGWVEIVVKVPKYDGDEGYALREDYIIKTAERAEREKAKAEAKAKKIAKDKAKRNSKKESEDKGE